MMYGKQYKSMYGGSMVGSGAHVFALMGYVISNMSLDKEVGAQVSLNPVLLAAIFGESVDRMREAIDFLCAPDKLTTTPGDDGRRLVQVGQFDYRVVNAVKYQNLKNEDERREKNRLRQADLRERQRNGQVRSKKPKPSASDSGAPAHVKGESEYQAAARRGASEEELEKIVTRNLPEAAQ